jgi:hypothetical protein
MKRLLVVSVLTCLAGGLRGQAISRPAAVGRDACSLLSRLEAQDESGMALGEGIPRLKRAEVASCEFAGKRGGQVAVLVRPFPGADWVSAEMERMSRVRKLGTYRQVAGIGTRAFSYELHGSGAQNSGAQSSVGVLCVFGSNFYLQISLSPLGEISEGPSVLKALARKAIERLQLTPLPHS